MKNSTTFMSLFCLVFLFTISGFSSQEQQEQTTLPKKTFRVPKVNSEINVDAYLNESFWQNAVKIEVNIEVRPGENIPAPVNTEVLLCHDECNIYVAFIAYDHEPDKIQAHFCDRDKIFDDDWVLILFDTFNDQRRTYDFACNPFGIQGDMIETPTSGGDEWDAIWESNGRITDEGYIVEMAIPFSSLNFPGIATDQIWGFDLVRSFPRDVRHHIGAFPRDRNNNCYMCQSDKLVGFAGVSPGSNIEIDPTFNILYSQERKDETSGSFITKHHKYNPGLTGSWGITPNIILSGTINPDFSNIEADVLQLDINNQFAIYYPEKRPFFLESGDFFNTPLNAVHTRTMADPNWGIKLSGREDIHTIGFFTVQDDMTNYLFPGTEGNDSESLKEKNQSSALRYKVDIGKSSNLGLLVTDRQNKKYFNRIASADGEIKFTEQDLFRFQTLRSNTQYSDSLAADYDQPSSDFWGNAYQVLYSHHTRDYEVYGYHEEIDNEFRSDMGYITQAGYRFTMLGGTYKWQQDPGHWYNILSASGSFDFKRDQDNNLIHRVVSAGINYEGPMQSHGHVYGEYGKDRYNETEFNTFWLQGCTGLYVLPDFFAHIHWRYGDQIDYANTRLGTRFTLNPYCQFNLGLHMKLELDHTYENLNVDVGRLYTANISRIKFIYQFNKRTFVRAILQYKDYDRNVQLYNEPDDYEPETQKLFSQFLFSYKINPHTVFFVGYSDDYYGDREVDFTQTNRTIFTKIGYALTL
ncbi:carbohydrate binding family 9 domain-containing protein [Calditrichota bacterium]